MQRAEGLGVDRHPSITISSAAKIQIWKQQLNNFVTFCLDSRIKPRPPLQAMPLLQRRPRIPFAAPSQTAKPQTSYTFSPVHQALLPHSSSTPDRQQYPFQPLAPALLSLTQLHQPKNPIPHHLHKLFNAIRQSLLWIVQIYRGLQEGVNTNTVYYPFRCYWFRSGADCYRTKPTSSSGRDRLSNTNSQQCLNSSACAGIDVESKAMPPLVLKSKHQALSSLLFSPLSPLPTTLYHFLPSPPWPANRHNHKHPPPPPPNLSR